MDAHRRSPKITRPQDIPSERLRYAVSGRTTHNPNSAKFAVAILAVSRCRPTRRRRPAALTGYARPLIAATVTGIGSNLLQVATESAGRGRGMGGLSAELGRGLADKFYRRKPCSKYYFFGLKGKGL